MKELLLHQLDNKCLSHTIDFDRGRATFTLIDSTKIYIRYNNHGQYAYVIQFSPKKWNRIRFDNYDENWEVKTKPHHLHTRNSENVIEARTNGTPKNDCEVILDVLKEHTKLF